MWQRLICSFGLVLVSTVASHAAIIGVVTKEVNPGAQTGIYAGFARNTTNFPSGPFATDTQLNSGTLADTWVAYSLGVTGERISSIAVHITWPITPTTGLHQRWNYNPNTMSFSPTPESTDVTDGDSHIIRLGSVIGVASVENNNLPGGPPTAVDNATQDYGVGSSLTAQFGLNAAEQQTIGLQLVKFAYLVVPRGFESKVQINVSVTGNIDPAGNPAPIFLTNKDFGSPFYIVPEPATAFVPAMVSIGFAVLGRRRAGSLCPHHEGKT